MDSREALEHAIKQAGGIVRTGRKLGLSRNAIHQWKFTPDRRVLELERISGVHCSTLRPDLYPPDRFGKV